MEHDHEKYAGGEEPQPGDIVEDTAGLFSGQLIVSSLGTVAGRSDADLKCWLGISVGYRTPMTLKLIRRG